MRKVYDPQTHTAILAVSPSDVYEIEAARRLGVEVGEPIEMPIDLCSTFYPAKLPDWLKLREEHEEDGADPRVQVFEFEDSKGRLRLRIIWSVIIRNFHVFTRYYTGDTFGRGGNSVNVAVFDAENPGEDPENPQDMVSFQDGNKEAEKWLDRAYPYWRDPLAYWS
jgi:hypothetical protein